MSGVNIAAALAGRAARGSFVAVGADQGLLARGSEQLAARFKNLG